MERAIQSRGRMGYFINASIVILLMFLMLLLVVPNNETVYHMPRMIERIKIQDDGEVYKGWVIDKNGCLIPKKRSAASKLPGIRKKHDKTCI